MSEAIKSAFELRYHLRLGSRLGFGRDGEVFLTNTNTAVKFFIESAGFMREGEVYETLARINLTHIEGHAVPQLIRIDDQLLAMEMTVVGLPSCSTSRPRITSRKLPILPKKF